MFALRLGVLATFLSEPVVKALTSGAALHVLVSQLPSLLGLPLPRQIGCFALFKVGRPGVTGRAPGGPRRRGVGEGGAALGGAEEKQARLRKTGCLAGAGEMLGPWDVLGPWKGARSLG